MAIERNCSKHISYERSDRITYILLNLGLGNIIKEQRCVEADGKVSWQCFTDTGVIIVYNEARTMIITAYVAQLPKVNAMYKGKTPSWVFRMVQKNKIHAEMQDKVRY